MRAATVLAAALTVVGVVAGCTSPAANRWQAAPAPAATAPASAAAPDPRDALPAALRPRVPRFAPPPAPEPVTLPADGTAGWFSRIPTTQKIAFITIDDGWNKDPLALKLFQAAHVPITLFLEVDAIKSDPGYFRPLQESGAVIENHTISHPNLKGRSYASQKREICGGADRLAAWYGRRPLLFRPPGGTHDATTLKVVHDCGMKAAFYWTETTDHGKVFYQQGHTVQPGDIILMHFRPRFVDDFLAVLKAIHDAGLTPARLQDYIP
jgi:peptidoglycan/xylan/chitin deacetylase (PgdA/CDA1 family)